MTEHGFDFSRRKELSRALETRFDSELELLSELVAIPSVAWESFDLTQVHRSAEKVRQLALDAGFETAEVLSAPYGEGKQGMPAVVAHKEAVPGSPTFLLYAHHDVQPAGDVSLWETAPFEATRVGDRLYGRGAADDKAGIIVHLAAFRAVSEVLGESFTAGVTLFIEGEEEAGSPSFEAFLETYRDRLAGDYIVVADSANWKTGIPALTAGLRGVASGDVAVRVSSHSVHSGMFGGPLLDANTVLVHLLASLHNSQGSVAVEGLISAPEPEVEYVEADFRTDSGILDSMTLAGTGSVSSRLWAQPAISIIGMDITPIAESSNTIASTAKARLSVRLAPGQDPEVAHRAVARHLQSANHWGAEVTYTAEDSGRPYQADLSDEGAQLALAALKEAWGVDPVTIGMGGSIPFIATLRQAYPQAHILITGVEDPDTRAHSANESLYLPDFKKAILAEALMLAAVSQPSN
ncbi:dipeptidase [Rothia nasimurium]|uniref:Dipeptidase n=1 Tax=Rothia nasimurium TaxID=85336 RepID=A0A1Y1RQC4_9MICC|nr:dipeptidase [Rothia nasimurium]ORC21997.1 dipeptidase [Rothia nasimurium]